MRPLNGQWWLEMDDGEIEILDMNAGVTASAEQTSR